MENKNNNDLAFQYAALIQSHIADMLDPDSESDYKIDMNEFGDEEKATAFLHALSNIVPCNMYRNLTGEDCDMLGFNHIANRLVVQFIIKQDEKGN
jgi:hypothetical protein